MQIRWSLLGLGIALTACKSAPAKPPKDVAVAPAQAQQTCEDVAARSWQLVAPVPAPGAEQAAMPAGWDESGLREHCVTNHWPQEIIHCAVAGNSDTEMRICTFNLNGMAGAPPPSREFLALSAPPPSAEAPPVPTPPAPTPPAPTPPAMEAQRPGASKFGLDCAKLKTAIAASGPVKADGGTPAVTGFKAIEGAALPDTSKYSKDSKSTLSIIQDRPGKIVRFPGFAEAHYEVVVATEPSQPPSAALIASSEALSTEVARCLPGWSRQPTSSIEPLEIRFRVPEDADDKVCKGGDEPKTARITTLRICERHHPSVVVDISNPTGRSVLSIRIDISSR
jgi:hypothetical protein